MSMPAGASGLDSGAWMSQWIVQGTGLSELASHTQDAISTYYQSSVLDDSSSSWQTVANNFFQNILSGFGSLGQFLELVVEATTGAPGALTDLQTFMTAQWGSLADSLSWLTDIGVLVDTFFKFLAGTKTQSDLDAAWIAVCSDFGVTSPNWTTFWDGIFAQYVTPTGIFSPSAWPKRLSNDLTILFDVFHWTYEAGSVGDAPGTLGTNGKATWYSAWNDLLSLVGIVNSTSAPIVTAPTIGESITTAQDTAQSGLDAVNQGITGAASTGATAAVVQSAAAGLAATIAQVQSNVNTLQNAGDAAVGGVQIVDDGPGTNATGAGWGSNWTLNTGSNANLHLGFQCLGGTAIGSYTGESLNTDNMMAGVIFNSLPNYNWLGDSADGARHRLKIRESSDQSSCVFADIWHDKAQIGYRKAGVDTYIGSATSVTAAAGSNWELYGGNAAGTAPYLFQLVQNGVMASPIVQWNDTGHVSNLGSSYRGAGQDMYSDGTYYPGNTKFHARDLLQPLLKTMMAEHRNTVSSASSLAAGAIYQLPVGWFNSQIYLMPGVTMDTAKAGYVVANEGLYEFSFAIELTSGLTGTPYIIAPVIWVNSAPYAEGQSVYAHDSAVSGYSAQITRSIYLFAGDKIYPALDTRANQWTVSGESSGTLSWMQLAKVG